VRSLFSPPALHSPAVRCNYGIRQGPGVASDLRRTACARLVSLSDITRE